MGYSRHLTPQTQLAGDALTGALSGLGMAFAIAPVADQNIEDAVLAASVAGMEEDDLRILGVLVAISALCAVAARFSSATVQETAVATA